MNKADFSSEPRFRDLVRELVQTLSPRDSNKINALRKIAAM